MRRLSKLIAALSVGLLLIPGIPAAADETPAELEPVMLVMDYSSSMLETDADAEGTSRIDAAKKATKHLINNAPDDATMGLVVYGSKTPKQCDDITTVQKPGPVHKQELGSKIDELKAVGETPIGASLLHAAKDMDDVDGAKSIILVSDGEENCSQPPACEAAKDLAAQGVDLTVHTIGFKVNKKAKGELECIAKATGGSYVTADDADALTEELTVRTLRAFAGYQASGTPISGADQMHRAPAMAPGQYLDTLEKGESEAFTSEDGTTKYYKVGPIKPGERAHFSATIIPDQSDHSEVQIQEVVQSRVELVNGQGRECSSGNSDTGDEASLGHPLSAYALSPDYREDTTTGCFADGTGELYAKVSRSGELQKDQPMDVELLYVLEPAIDATLLGAQATKEDAPQSVKVTADPQPVLGGSSFNDALEVQSQKSYEDSVMSNEARYYKIHVGNGQKLNVRITGKASEDSAVAGVRTRVYSAVRNDVSMIGSNSISKTSNDPTATLNMRTAVSQSNREGVYGKDSYMAGDYYVVVHSQTFYKNNGVPFDYELAFDVSGTEQPFAGEAPIFSASPAESAAANESAAPTEAAASPEPTATQQAAPASSDSGPLWPWFLGGLVGTVLLLGIGTFLYSHRATSRS
ncbi:VWA domain-containing protein [Glutamicibacter sp.]|uniref:vWA domain-containing protein n=1 Tax=Glutamicibacter sp. TaxID=1931995 RepID=UPI0028BE1333|nr:VWA domain-containing protein [Glutamicibacter sp.]